MGTKTINIMDDVYDMLVAVKTDDESFSDEIRRLLKNKTSIMDYAGAWKGMSDGEVEDMKKTITKMRKGTRLKEVVDRC